MKSKPHFNLSTIITSLSLKAIMLCSILITSKSVTSQNLGKANINFETSSRYKSQNIDLSNKLETYSIIEANIKLNVIETAKTILKINLNDESIDLTLFDNNITLNKSLASNIHTLSGHTSKGGNVSLTIANDFIYGHIKMGQRKLIIQPLYYFDRNAPQGTYISYYEDQVKESHKGHICGEGPTEHIHETINTKGHTSGCKIVDIAIANTYDMVEKYHSEKAVTNHNVAVLNDMQCNYRSEFNINLEFNLVALYIPSSEANDPLYQNGQGNVAAALLHSFRSWSDPFFISNPTEEHVGFGSSYNIATVWTARKITQNEKSIIGLAYNNGWYSIVKDYSPVAPKLANILSHEIGHNIGCRHDGEKEKTIMSTKIKLSNKWSEKSKNEAVNKLQSIHYFPDCGEQGAPRAIQLQRHKVACLGAPVSFKDQSYLGADREWSFENGYPTKSTDAQPIVTFNNLGLHRVNLKTSNSAGTDTEERFIHIVKSSQVDCIPAFNYGQGGITNLTINNISYDSPLAEEVGNYEDYSCDNIIDMNTNSTYLMQLNMTDINYLKVYIDNNADGRFDTSSEEVASHEIYSNGKYLIYIKTSSNPIYNQLLRLRIITSDSPITDACHQSTSGQTEDYGVYYSASILGCTNPESSNYNPTATIDDGSCAEEIAIKWYIDKDQDGYGINENTILSYTKPTGYSENAEDCNDNDATVYPGAIETCNGKDNDCNGYIDDNITQRVYYIDSDGDGYGLHNISLLACQKPAGYSPIQGDCDDDNPNVNPGGTELCDNIDNNCNGSIDEYSCEGQGAYIWEDANGNNRQDDNEYGLEGISVRLYNAQETVLISEQLTDADGYYIFKGIPDGEYIMVFDQDNIDDKYLPNIDTNNTNFQSSNLSSFVTTNTFAIKNNVVNYPPLCYYVSSKIEGAYVTNKAELVIDQEVILYIKDGEYVKHEVVKTDGGGRYVFDRLPTGEYYLEFVAPEAYSFVTEGTSVIYNYQQETINIGQTMLIHIATDMHYSDISAVVKNQSSAVLSVDESAELHGYYEESTGHVELEWSNYEVENINSLTILKTIVTSSSYDADKESEASQLNFDANTSYGTDSNIETNNYLYQLSINYTSGKTLLSNIVAIEVDRKSSLSIYPNPVCDQLHIKSSKVQDLTIFNASGHQLAKLNPIERNGISTYDMSQIPSGVCFAHYKEDNIIRTEKIFVMK